MKQRLLFVLLALFTSIGLVNAKVSLTIPKGETGSLSFTAKSGAIVVNSGSGVTSYSIKEADTKNSDLKLAIDGDLATLRINVKVSSIVVEDVPNLTSLVFENGAKGSTIGTFSFSFSNSGTTGSLKTLTADEVGLKKLPTGYYSYLASGASLSFKKNNLSTITKNELALNKKATYYFDGNKIYEWPEELKEAKDITINYGSQSSLEIPRTASQANNWFDIWNGDGTADNGVIHLYSNLGITVNDLNFAWRKGTSGSFNQSLIMKSNTYPGQFQFYSNNAWQSGTYQCQITPKQSGKAPTYVVTVNVKPAQFTLVYSATPANNRGGTFTIEKMDGGTTLTSGTAKVQQGEKLVLKANPDKSKGYSLPENGIEVVGLKKTDTPNVYEVVGVAPEITSQEVKAIANFTQGKYKLTLDINSENGSEPIITNKADGKTVTNGQELEPGTILEIKVTPRAGFEPSVIVNKSELSMPAADANGVYTYTTPEINKATTIQVLYKAKKEYTLYVGNVTSYELTLNGTLCVKDGGYYKIGTSKFLPKFQSGELVTLEMNKTTDNSNQTIKKILLNAKEITPLTIEGKKVKVQFEMPSNDATITFEYATLAKLVLGTNIKSANGSATQTFTYDRKAHGFEIVTVPSGLTNIELQYTKKGQSTNYIDSEPIDAGTYLVRVYRKADSSYEKFLNERRYEVVINKATPTITTIPRVTVNSDGDYVISGGVAQVGGKNVDKGEWTVINGSDKAITKCTETKSHIATVAFIPEDKDNLNGTKADNGTVSEAAMVQVNVTIGDALKTHKVTLSNIPSDMTLTVWNGELQLSGSALNNVPEGTGLTFKLTYPAGYKNVVIVVNKADGEKWGADENKDGLIETVTKRTVDGPMDITVTYANSPVKMKPVVEKAAEVNPVKYEYTGNIDLTKLFTSENFGFKDGSIVATDENELKKKMVISYKDASGKAVVSPVNAGKYTVVVTIPEVKTANATYEAITQEFDIFEITKVEYKVSDITWPTDAVVGVGKNASTAQFIGGSAPVEGTFHFIEESSITSVKTGDEYYTKFVPADATNYAEVLPSNVKAKIVVTDQRTLFISDVTNGTVVVTDQNGNALKNEQTLNSSITSIKVTATPASGYTVGSIRVNNSTLSNGGSYTLGSDNVVVNVTFVRQYTITLGSAPRGVKIATKPSSNVVNAGGSYTFTLNHVSGDKPTVTGASNISVSTSGSTTTVKVTNIQSNATLAIALANPTAIKITTKETLSAANKPMGTIRVSGVNSSNECYYGDKITVTATANPGVEFAGWEGLTSTENPYEFEATNATYTIQAKYHGTLTGIESVDELKYYGGDGYIFVNCPAQGTLTIISMNGRAQKMSVSGQTRVTVPAGVYGIVLTSGSEVVRDKVVVR